MGANSFWSSIGKGRISERAIRGAIWATSVATFGIVAVSILGKVDMSVRGDGIVQFSQETPVYAIRSGIVYRVFPVKGSVKRGQPLMVIVRSDRICRIEEIVEELEGAMAKAHSLGAIYLRIERHLLAAISELRKVEKLCSNEVVGKPPDADTIFAPVEGIPVGIGLEELVGKFFHGGEKLLTIRHPPRTRISVALPPESFFKVKVGQRALVSIGRSFRCTGMVSELATKVAGDGIRLIAKVEPASDFPSFVTSDMPARAKIIVEEGKPIYRLLWEAAFHRPGKQALGEVELGKGLHRLGDPRVVSRMGV